MKALEYLQSIRDLLVLLSVEYIVLGWLCLFCVLVHMYLQVS